MVIQQGQINTTALIVPDLYVQIVPPTVSLLNGVPTNILGCVGTATWGPANAPVTLAGMADYARTFGALQARKYDLGTFVAAAVLQGANNFRAVRITDGTDVAASVILKDNAPTPLTEITFTSFYTGTLGNSTQVTIGTGTNNTAAAPTYKVTVAMPGRVGEVFDNIGGTGAAVWTNIVNAINNGQSGLRGPSQLITAAVGTSAVAPTLATSNLIGGTDGATTISSSVLLGQDTSPRKGMYALRNTGASIGALVDCDDTTSFTSQVSFGLSEGIYMVGTTPASDSISNAISTKQTAGIDSYAFKYLLGDWCVFNDTVNGQQRLISPQGYVCGELANLGPHESPLNKPIYGIVATERSRQHLPYSSAELAQLAQAGIDVICNPQPGGAYFGVRIGHNSSSNAVTNTDTYTRMTNYIAYTLNAGMGKFVGRLQTPDEQREAKTTLDAFLQALWDQGMIGNSQGAVPFQVTLDGSNNPQNRVALGYQQADVKVQYLSVVEKFLINVEGGQSVTITRQSTAPAA